MIKVSKSSNPPLVLTGKGRDETENNKQSYDANPTDYHTGKKKFKFKSSIYGHSTVKQQLIDEQSGKCCFCEARFTSNGFGDIEHFRPKGGYLQKKSDKIKRPGYYWKAYDWDNLFFSCEVCNTRYKKNYFPLKEETRRAKSHHDNTGGEQPLLVHPSQDDPETHIGFRREVGFPKDEKGDKSISAYGLNRDALLEKRREFLNNVKNNEIISRLDLENMTTQDKQNILDTFNMSEEELEDLVMKARLFMERAAHPGSPFASMVRHNFPEL